MDRRTSMRLAVILSAVVLPVGLYATTVASSRPPAPPLDADGRPLPPSALLRIGSTRLRSSGTPQALAFTADGQQLMTIDLRTAVHVWDVAAGKELRSFGHLAGDSPAFAASPDGSLAALVESADTCRVYDSATGRVVHVLQGDWAKTRALCFSADGKQLVSANEDKLVRFWDVATHKLLRQFQADKAAQWRNLLLALSASGKMLAFGSPQGSVEIWDSESGKRSGLVNLQEAAVPGRGFLAFSPKGDLLATVDDWRNLNLWDVASGKAVRPFPAERGPFWCAAFSSDGKAIATGNFSGKVCIWNTSTGKLERVLKGHRGEVESLAVSPDGKRLATSSGGCTVRIWDVESGQQLHVFAGPHAPLLQAQYTTDGKAVLSMANTWYYDKTLQGSALRWWDPAGGLAIKEIDFDPEKLGTWTVSGDGFTLAVASKDGKIRVHDLHSDKAVPRVLTPERPVLTLHLTTDGRYLAAQTLARLDLHVWDTRDGTKVLEIKGTPDSYSPGFAGDGYYLVAQSYFGANSPVSYLALWDVWARRRVLQSAKPISVEGQAAFSTSGRLLASPSQDGQGIAIYEIASGQPVLQSAIQEKPTCFAFAPGATALAVGTEHGKVLLWDLVAKTKIGTLSGHSGRICSVGFSPDAKQLVSGGDDTTMVVWDISQWNIGRRPPPAALAPDDADRLWKDLAAVEASAAYTAVLQLVRSPKEAVALIRRQLRPAVHLTQDKAIARWIADLDSDRYAQREQATANLKKAAEAALPALERTLASNPPLEVQTRVKLLLSKIESQPLSRDLLQASRAIEALEMIATSDATDTLEWLATGAPEAWETLEAKASVERLRKRLGAR